MSGAPPRVAVKVVFFKKFSCVCCKFYLSKIETEICKKNREYLYSQPQNYIHTYITVTVYSNTEKFKNAEMNTGIFFD
jgi:hypothetical protein